MPDTRPILYLTTDDPYYYLYFGSAPRPPSYFALDRDQPEVGRVARFDSLSKVLSSGMRIGFLSAPQPIIDAVVMHVSPRILLCSLSLTYHADMTMTAFLRPWVRTTRLRQSHKSSPSACCRHGATRSSRHTSTALRISTARNGTCLSVRCTSTSLGSRNGTRPRRDCSSGQCIFLHICC